MKKKIWITALVVVLVVAIGVAVSAGIYQKNNVSPDDDLYQADPSAPATRTYTNAQGQALQLTYQRSLTAASGKPLHYYKDAAGNEYSFSAEGEFIGYTPNQNAAANTDGIHAQPATPDTKVENTADEGKTDTPPAAPQESKLLNTKDAAADDKEQALIDTARQSAAQMYGEAYFARFTYQKMVKNEALGRTDIFFYIRYRDRFITECCIATMNGTQVEDVMISGKGTDDGFDPALIESIEIKTLEAFTEGKIKEAYPDGYHSYEIEEDITISKNDNGKYELIIAADVQTDPRLSGTRVKYNYPLQ